MRRYTPVFTLALLSALALAVVSGGLLPSDNAVHADHITAATNTAPVFAAGGDARSVAENSPPGVNVGAPISATDAAGDVLTYTLGGTDEASFDIDAATGQIITKTPLNADAVTGGTASYSVTVTVDDGREAANSSATVDVTITITDVNEPPAAPAAPVVTTGAVVDSETTTLEINWYAPENTGDAITDYDYRYKKTTETTWTPVDDTAIAVTTASISGLEADTAYQVSVRAESSEGDSPWSLSGVGSTNKAGNAAPVFSGPTAARSVLENTPAGQRVGATVTATDANSTTLNYSLAGEDADSFDIEESTGQILTKAELNHESKDTYTVMVVVDDDGDGGSDVITVTITVTDDVNERPSRPAAPTVKMVEDDPTTNDSDSETDSDDESATRLKVSWVAPETEGPAITGYNLEYREGTSGTFSDDNCGAAVSDDNCQDIAGTETTIVSLGPSKSYQVRVTAISDEGNSQPSLPGTGRTGPANRSPVFSTATTNRNVNENTPADRNIGSRVTARDPDRDPLTYSLDATGAATFDIDETTGQIKTKTALDHEASSTHTVTVTATDRKRATDTIEVVITVNDRREPPEAPSDLKVTLGTTTPHSSLGVAWTAPDNAGKPDISEYQVQYRASGSWTSVSDVGTSTTATITGLNAYTTYYVQVRARNAEGDSPWVSSSERTNKENNALPAFTDGTDATRAVQENVARGRPVGQPVGATDGDADDLTYSLGGEHASLFDINRSDGQISVKADLNFEAECGDASGHETVCTYSVVVKVVDGNGGSATIPVTINVGDNTSEAPSVPSAPKVSAAAATDDEPNLDPTSMLLVSWNEPQNHGPSITGYAVQYKISGGNFQTDTTGDIIVFEGRDNANRSAVITGLDDDTSYQVQVMATNAEGSSGWSSAGTGRTRFANTRPAFSRSHYERTVEENTPSGRSIGLPVDATDADSQRLTYTLEGVHKEHFTIESRTGHIRTSGPLDHESRSSYSLTVRATDTEGGSAAASVTIQVENENEAPTAPGAPTVSGIAGSTDSVRVTWAEPANEGRPPIIDYDVQYRTGSGEFNLWEHRSTDTSTIIAGLRAGTRYEVQIRASNADESSDWSPSGTGSPDPDPSNVAPVFSGGPRTFSVAENTAAGVNIGNPVTATDSDPGDTLSYSLEGTDAASFSIVAATGQIQTRGALNYEDKASHSVTVKADDSNGGVARLAVTIRVTDVSGEAPLKPGVPTVASASSTSLTVTWQPPANPGPPITDYDYRYKETSGSSWTDVVTTTITATSVTIRSLSANTSYDVQVRAKNAEGTGVWSDSGTGTPSAPVANRAPEFPGGASSATRTVVENAQAGVRVGAPVSATDPDPGDTVSYSLVGTDRASFAIDPGTGQITTRVALSTAQVGDTFTVTVVASDGTAEARITVTITVRAVMNVAPSRPGAPTVTRNASSATSLDVSWDAPDNLGPTISDYDYRYKIAPTGGGIVIVQPWIEITNTTITDTSVTIASLRTGTEYEVQVRATNSVGTTDWSPSGRGTPVTPGTNTPPRFSPSTTSRSVAENTPAGTNFGTPVAATDSQGDSLTYSLGGQHASSFNIDRHSGQLRTRAALDYEARSSYSVTVTASDGTATAQARVTISVTDRYPGCTTQASGNRGLTNDCEALLASKSALEGRGGRSLNWSESRPVRQWNGIQGHSLFPSLSGSPQRVTALHLQRSGLNGTIPASLAGVSELAFLNVHSNSLRGNLAALNGMTNLERAYVNNNEFDGIGDLSGATSLQWLWAHRNNDHNGDGQGGLGGSAVPAANTLPTSLVWLSLYDNGHTGRIPDLSSLSNLNWLYLHKNELSGSIPSELGQMSSLLRLYLYGNNLSGSIPASLGSLGNMTHLVLVDNDLSGSIPSELGRLSKLEWLSLYDNDLSGSIPSELGQMSSLLRLYLHRNSLSGTVPPELGNLSALTNLWLVDNDLSGQIPTGLGNLRNLVRVRIAGTNSFTGCVPAGLLDGPGRTSDAEDLGLPTCS